MENLCMYVHMYVSKFNKTFTDLMYVLQKC